MTKQRRNTYVKSQSSATLLSLERVRKYCNQDFVSDDEKILACLAAAQFQAENFLRRTLIQKVLVLQLDYFPWCRDVVLEMGPVSSVVEIRYRDGNDEQAILDTSYYALDVNSVPNVVSLEPNQAWPSTYSGRRNAVEVEYNAGYATGDFIPPEILKAVEYMTKHFYDNPDMFLVGASQVVKVPDTAETLMWSHRDYRF